MMNIEFFKKHGHVIIWGVIVLLIIILAISGSKEQGEGDSSDSVNQDEVVDLAGVENGASGIVTSMQPYEQDPHVYTFSGVSWEVTSGDTDVTAIAMRLEDFSRWANKSPVNLRRPFWVGTYTGDCSKAESTGIAVEGLLVGALNCDSGVEIAVTQDQISGNLIHVYDFSNGETNLVRTIDMTTIVQ